MKLGEKEPHFCNDLVDVELNPCDLKILIELVETESLSTESYYVAGVKRTLKDLLQKRLNEWRKLRDEKDNPGEDPDKDGVLKDDGDRA